MEFSVVIKMADKGQYKYFKLMYLKFKERRGILETIIEFE